MSKTSQLNVVNGIYLSPAKPTKPIRANNFNRRRSHKLLPKMPVGRGGVVFWQGKKCLSEASYFSQKKITPHPAYPPRNQQARSPSPKPRSLSRNRPNRCPLFLKGHIDNGMQLLQLRA